MDQKRRNDRVGLNLSRDSGYNNPTPGQISIIGSGFKWYREKPTGPPESTKCGAEPYETLVNLLYTDEQLEDVKGCLCNMVLARLYDKVPKYGGLTEEERKLKMPCIQLSLDAAAATGMKVFVTLATPPGNVNIVDPLSRPDSLGWDKLADQWVEVVKQFKDHPGLGGWFLCDEPTYVVFGRLAAIKEKILAIDPNHLVVVNLLPKIKNEKLNGSERICEDGPGGQIACMDSPVVITSYEDYLDKFHKIFKPQVWSYDFYPVKIREGVQQISDAEVKEQFFE